MSDDTMTSFYDDMNATSDIAGAFWDDTNLLPFSELSDSELLNLSSWQRDAVDGLTAEGQRCLFDSWMTADPQLTQGVYCNATWDGYRCWPMTPANMTVVQPCPLIFGRPLNWTAAHFLDIAVGHRTCTSTGRWLHDSWTNYTMCVLLMMMQQNNPTDTTDSTDSLEDIYYERYREAVILRDIYFSGSIISLLMLLTALFVFTYFRSLQCARITIHKHLIGSFVLRSVLIFIVFEPFVTGRQYSYRSLDWLCKTLTAMSHYATIANTAWMFVEGLFLHQRVAVSVFRNNELFHLYYIIGWGVPLPFIISWAICMYIYNPNSCWNGSFEYSHSWLISFPILAFLVVNSLFLINIIRIVITKLQATNSVELDNKVRMAVKATVVLFPLLGTTNILFCIEPKSGALFKLVYRITNAVLQSSQGIFVSVIYCFLNGEVRSAVDRKYRRCVQQRARRRSSAMRTMSVLESFR